MSASTEQNSKKQTSNRTGEGGHRRPSQHSLMDTSGGPSSILWWTPQREAEAQNANRDVLCGTLLHCFARVMEIANWIHDYRGIDGF